MRLAEASFYRKASRSSYASHMRALPQARRESRQRSNGRGGRRRQLEPQAAGCRDEGRRAAGLMARWRQAPDEVRRLGKAERPASGFSSGSGLSAVRRSPDCLLKSRAISWILFHEPPHSVTSRTVTEI